MNKSGKFKMSMVQTAFLSIILLVVLFQFAATAVPTAQTAGDLMNNTARCEAVSCFWNETATNCQVNSTNTANCATEVNLIPLSGLVSGNGVAFVVVMASLLIMVVVSFMKGRKK